MSETRERIIEATSRLLEAQGYHATGINQIIAESKTPKGSLYYYFPEGKEELTAEAMQRAGRKTEERIRVSLVEDDEIGRALPAFLYTVAHYIEASGCAAGGPLTMVAMESVNSSERINLACREAYRLMQEAFADKLIKGGYSDERARQLAVLITAAVEGGIMLSRVYHSGDPLRRVADELGSMLREGDGG